MSKADRERGFDLRKTMRMQKEQKERQREKVRKLNEELLHTPFLRVQGCYQVDLVVLVLPLGFIFWVYAYLIPCLFSKKRKQIEN